MNYTKIPATTFENIQLNAGILLDNFDPATGEIGNIIGATTGGITFAATPSYTDYGDDIDNCPKNTKELKKQDSVEAKMSGTFVTVTASLAHLLIAAGDIDANDPTHIVPRKDIEAGDFKDIWWVGDYSDKNNGANAGYCAIHLMNALSTAGFQIKSADKAKGQFAFEFTGHFSILDQDTVPYEVYVKGGGDTPTPYILFNKHSVRVKEGDTFVLDYTVYPENATVTITLPSGDIVTREGNVYTAADTGSGTITASITVDSVEYTDTCTVKVTAA